MAATATAAGGAAKHDSGVDEDLYSRQLAVFGAETMGKLMQLKVLIIGMRGTGVEIAKNLTLAGPKSVVIHDPTPVTLPDLGNNFYLRESDVGKRRDEATLEQLSDLNKYVKVTVLPSMEGLDFSAFDIVVAADQVQSKSVAWNAAARAAGAAFILADVAGVTARIFTDFGAEHVVLDTNGENPKVAIVNAMVHNDDGSLTVFCDGRTGLVEGNHVNFKEITGATALNDVVAVPVTKLSATGATFTVPASALPADLGEYTGPGGIVTQAKLPVTLAFAPLSERLDQPFPSDKQGGIDIVDYSKMGRAYTLHAAYQGLDAFAAANGGAAPAPHSPADVAAVLEGAKAFVAGQLAKPEVVEAWTAAAWQPPPEVDEEVVTSTARYAAVQLPGLAAFIGGVAAQEIVKLTGKYTPLRQWLYWDTFEAVPKPEPAADFAGTGDRYHFSNVIFGKTVTDLVRQQRVFLVGAGALGCEYLKSFALAGVGTAGEGKIIVTDMDNIETSNLNRQFLFRTKDVGSAKSVCGAAAAQAMNPDMKGRVEAMEERVGGETEDIFGERFWSGVDIVTNALDNVAARRYMDERCVWFSKPLLESGTLGTMGNTMPIFTRMTKTYNDSQDVEGDSIPMCTLKNFPYQIEHCIEWARDQFEGLFTQSIAEARSFVTDPADWTAEWIAEGAKLGPGVARSKATAVLEVLDLVQGATWEGCVHHARLRFEEVFAARVKQLIHNFPEDKRTANGSLFWSGKRRYPTPAAFDVADPMHCAYVAHGAALFANCFGVAIPADWSVPEALGKVAATAAVPEWAPRAEVIKTEEDGDEVKEGASDDKEAVVALGQRLAKVGGESAAVLAALADKLTPEEFEKDDDNNHHIDFITAASNLRAGNYRIDALSRHKTKVIAGKITPAIATTTCAVTGLNMIEFYKFVQFNAGVGIEKAVEATRESNMNLAVSHYQLFEAAPTKASVSREDDTTLTTYRSVPEGFTKWDRIEVPADLPDTTLQGVVDFVVGWAVAKSKEEAAGNADLSEVDAAACTPYLLGDAGLLMYNASEPSTHDTLSKDVFSLYEELITAKGGPKPKPEYIVLHSFSVQIDGDDELELPTVVVNRPPAGPGAAAQ